MPLYRGWSVVIACGILASFSWGLGLVGAATQAGVALGPGFMGLLHDVLGSYQTALWCLVALEGIAAVLVLGGRAGRDDP